MQAEERYRFQLIQRRLRGYIYYELFSDKNQVGSIKKANVPGAPVRIRGRNGFDLIVRHEQGELDNVLHRMVETENGAEYAKLISEEEDMFCYQADGQEDILIHQDASGYACTRKGRMIVHIEKQKNTALSLKTGLTGHYTVSDVQRMYVFDPEAEDLIVALTGAVFLLFWNTGDQVHEKNRCYRCMKEFDYGYDFCPHCGFDLTERPVVSKSLNYGLLLKDRYMVGEMFLEGGDFLSYHGWDTVKGREVTIREFFPLDFVKRLQGEKDVIVVPEEAYPQYMKELDRYMDQFHIVAGWPREVFTLTDGFEENVTAYLVYDSARGNRLSEYLKEKDGKLEPQEAADIAKAICKAVGILHADGKIFGEVCMEQVIYLDDKSVKLEPTGAYQLLKVRETGEQTDSWKNGRYAAPELLEEKVMVGPWIDVYSIGAVLWQLLTGKEPADAGERLEGKEIPFGEGEHKSLMAIAEKAMALELTKRYYDASAMLDALNAQD